MRPPANHGVSLVAEGDYGIDAGGAIGGNPTGDQRGGAERAADDDERCGVPGAHTNELGAQEGSCSDGEGQADREANRGQGEAVGADTEGQRESHHGGFCSAAAATRLLPSVGVNVSCGPLRGGFGAEDALEARADELNPNQLLAGAGRGRNVYHSTERLEVILGAAHGRAVQRDTNLQVGTDGHSKARAKRSSAATQVFAGRIFLEGKPSRVFPPNTQR
jgi:hypothetical protein